MGKVYHIGLTKKVVRDARLVLLPGDPFRVGEISKRIDPDATQIACSREYCSYLASSGDNKILVMSTGMGGPSTSIAVDELASLGLKIFLRVGTCGAIQKNIKPGDVIVTSGAVRLDGASTHYAPVEYPAVADYRIVNALVESSRSLNIKAYTGVTASTDTFYPAQERYDSFSGHVLKRFQGSMNEFKKLHVLNYEMESATLLTMAASFGLSAGCITGVVVNRTTSEKIKKINLATGEKNAVKVAVNAIKQIMKVC